MLIPFFKRTSLYSFWVLKGPMMQYNVKLPQIKVFKRSKVSKSIKSFSDGETNNMKSNVLSVYSMYFVIQPVQNQSLLFECFFKVCATQMHSRETSFTCNTFIFFTYCFLAWIETLFAFLLSFQYLQFCQPCWLVVILFILLISEFFLSCTASGRWTTSSVMPTP